MNREVVRLYNALKDSLLPRKDSYLTRLSLFDLLNKEDDVKQAWLQGARLVWSNLSGSVQGSYLRGMRQCFRRWIDRSGQNV